MSLSSLAKRVVLKLKLRFKDLFVCKSEVKCKSSCCSTIEEHSSKESSKSSKVDVSK